MQQPKILGTQLSGTCYSENEGGSCFGGRTGGRSSPLHLHPSHPSPPFPSPVCCTLALVSTAGSNDSLFAWSSFIRELQNRRLLVVVDVGRGAAPIGPNPQKFRSFVILGHDQCRVACNSKIIATGALRIYPPSSPPGMPGDKGFIRSG